MRATKLELVFLFDILKESNSYLLLEIIFLDTLKKSAYTASLSHGIASLFDSKLGYSNLSLARCNTLFLWSYELNDCELNVLTDFKELKVDYTTCAYLRCRYRRLK